MILDPNALPLLVTPPPGPLSRAWLARLRAVESPNVTAIGADFPVVWRGARGAVVEDVDGNRYLDAGAAFGVAFIGHGHAAVRAAATLQTETLLHGMGDVHPPTARIELLEALAAVAPGDLGFGVLCTGGAEAVEVALKTALLATGKRGIVAFEGGYHGLSLGALGGTARADFRTPFAPWLPGPTTFVPYPAAAQGADVGGADAEAAALGVTLAAVERALCDPVTPAGVVLVEPLQGRGGNVVPAAGLLVGLRALCDQYGALLALDEIFTGCGRTGTFFACSHDDGFGAVLPDLLCVGKALGGGFPVSACLGRPQVMAAWGESTGEALHTSTFLGHPVAAAAATATLRVIADEALVVRASVDGAALQRALRDALAGSPAVVAVRGRGLMIGVALRDVGAGSGSGDTQHAGALAWQVVLGCLRRGVLVLPCGGDGSVIQLTPPAVMTAEQRAFLVGALTDAIAEAVVRRASRAGGSLL